MEITIPSLLRIKPNSLNKIGKYLRQEGFNTIALFYGEGIKEMFHERVSISLDSSEIKILYDEVVNSNHIEDIYQTNLNFPIQTKAIIAIGGGKTLDFSKYLAFMNQLPLIVVPTIISNDSFCSPFSSLLINGQRRTVKTIIPFGIIVDTEIIGHSPHHFIYSGIGDLFGKATALYDWRLAFKKNGELINDFAKVITQNAIDNFYYYENKNIENLEYLRIVISSLLMTGLAMLIAKSSRPASGSEHLISHAYDKISKNPSLHGLQVGVASYAVSYLQEETMDHVKKMMFDSKFFDYMVQNPLNKVEFIEAVKIATTIKENFYTVLSEKGSIDKILDFIDKDDILNRMLK